QHLRILVNSAMHVHYAAGEQIFREGDPANRFFLILSGKVRIESSVQGYGFVPIQTLGPGDDLGWAWLFPPYRMHFSSFAIEPTQAIFFYGTRLREQCEENHELGYQLVKRIAQVVIHRLLATEQRLSESLQLSM